MKAPYIPESEWTVMEALWEKSPQTASAVAKDLHESTGWADNTVRTLLTRLVEKGALVIVDPSVQPRCYAPTVKRELCVQAESTSFLDRIFRGAAKPLLVHFARNAKLTEEEARELKNCSINRSMGRLLENNPNKPVSLPRHPYPSPHPKK